MSLERKLRMFAVGAAMMGLSSILACTTPVSTESGKNNKAQTGCVSDSECKGGRICVKGECVDKESPINNYPPPVDVSNYDDTFVSSEDVYNSPEDVTAPKDSYFPKDTSSSDSGNNYDYGNNFNDLNNYYDVFLGCNSNQWQCNDGKCIPQNYLCDGGNDCNNGEDEYNCFKNDVYVSDNGSSDANSYSDSGLEDVGGCSPNDYQCNSGKCIPQNYLCDGGTPDCPGGEDEYNCFNNDAGSSDIGSDDSSSGCSGFECYDSTCYPASYQCDGAPDCNGGEDEYGCPPLSGEFGGACSSNEDCGLSGFYAQPICLTNSPISWSDGNCSLI